MRNTSPFPAKPKKRSPFPRRSLPQAGESLRDALVGLYWEKLAIFPLMAICFATVAGIEWWTRWTGQRVSPWLWTFIALGFGVMSIWRWFSIDAQFESLKLGVRGEREVGRALEDLRELGYSPFHDFQGEGFNIDHALVGPAGVFAIETKTLSMPAGRRAEVHYDGKEIRVDGKTLDRNPVVQAEAVADYLQELLNRLTARQFAVRPVVLFPGWWVELQSRDCRTWVLNPKMLASFLEREPRRISQEEIALIKDRMSLHLSSE